MQFLVQLCWKLCSSWCWKSIYDKCTHMNAETCTQIFALNARVFPTMLPHGFWSNSFHMTFLAINKLWSIKHQTPLLLLVRRNTIIPSSLNWLIPDFVYAILVQRSILATELNFSPFWGCPNQSFIYSNAMFLCDSHSLLSFSFV